jgi:hypothetical protein
MSWQPLDSFDTWALRNGVGAQGARFYGALGSDFTCSATAGMAATTSLDLRAAIAPEANSFNATRNIISRRSAALANYELRLAGLTGNLELVVSTAGSASGFGQALPFDLLQGSKRFCVRATWTASPAEIKLYWKPYVSVDDMALDTGWTQAGATVTASVPSTALLHTPSIPLVIGSRYGTAGTYFLGTIYGAQVQTEGVTVASPRFSEASTLLDAQSNQFLRTGVAPTVSPIFTGDVQIPAATAPGQPGQITAISSPVGRQAIGGAEIGDTGWRRVFTWTNGVQDGTNQIGTIDTAVFDLGGTAGIWLRRSGDTVAWQVVAPTLATPTLRKKSAGGALLCSDLAVIPSGFRPATGGENAGRRIYVALYSGVSDHPAAWGNGSINNVGAFTFYSASANTEFANCRWEYTATPATWPSTLPGVPA